MLGDPHLSVRYYAPNSDQLFPGTDIKGGVVVTYRDSSRTDGPIGTFTKHPELDTIIFKVTEAGGTSLTALGITNDRVYRYTQDLHDDEPQARSVMSDGNHYKLDSRAFTRLASVYFAERPADGASYVSVLGMGEKKKRTIRWIRAAYITGPDAFHKFKVALPKASGSGAFGETLAPPLVLEPDVAVTDSFITIGAFDRDTQAQACLKYVKSKFARAMLGVLKVTQDNLARVWEFVPAQEFTTDSDIDWTTSIAEIDQQLYAKYGLDAHEIAFIEAKVKPME